MNKTISINIGGRIFFVEEEAFDELKAYLGSIKAYFAKYPDSQEIMADMENRIAEKFAEKDKDNQQSVITASDVRGLIKELGTVQELSQEDSGEGKGPQKEQAETLAPKRLMRNPDDAIIAGVCSGIAAYFDLDPTLVRLAFALLVFAWGAVIPIYLLLWLVMPEAKTATEKMQMRGTPINVSSLKQTIKERAERFKYDPGKTKKGLSALASKFAEIVKFLVKLGIKIAGLAIVVLGAIAVAALTFAAVVAIFKAHSPYLAFPMALMAGNPAYFVLVVAGYLLLLVPAIFLMLLGASVFRNRNAFNTNSGLGLLGVWLLALIIGGIFAIDAVPSFMQQVKNSPEMQISSKNFETGGFNAVKLTGPYEYHLVESNDYGVKVTGRQADLGDFSISNNNGTLTVSRMEKPKICIFCSSDETVVEITAPAFSNISASDAAWIGSDNLTATNTTISLSRASRANVNVTAANLNLVLDSASRIRPTGSVGMLSATLDHASSLEGLELDAENASINLLHASHAKVYVLTRISVAGDTSSSLDYIGQPAIETRSTGPGRVRQLPASQRDIRYEQ